MIEYFIMQIDWNMHRLVSPVSIQLYNHWFLIRIPPSNRANIISSIRNYSVANGNCVIREHFLLYSPGSFVRFFLLEFSIFFFPFLQFYVGLRSVRRRAQRAMCNGGTRKTGNTTQRKNYRALFLGCGWWRKAYDWFVAIVVSRYVIHILRLIRFASAYFQRRV